MASLCSGILRTLLDTRVFFWRHLLHLSTATRMGQPKVDPPHTVFFGLELDKTICTMVGRSAHLPWLRLHCPFYRCNRPIKTWHFARTDRCMYIHTYEQAAPTGASRSRFPNGDFRDVVSNPPHTLEIRKPSGQRQPHGR